MVALDRAYRHCAQAAAAHYENFPVASWLLPQPARPHIAAIYAFARGADDLADEGTATPEERLDALAAWRARLHAAVSGHVAPGPDAPVFQALAASIHACSLPVSLFDDLISAFSQDVTVHRYDTWSEVLDYCRRSANPIGRLVLQVCHQRGNGLEEASDRVCTALQLANFWQDLGSDWERGRLYLPRDIWRRAGADARDFNPGALTPAWRAALNDALERTTQLFEEGRVVCDLVSGRLRYELRLTWLGGTRIVERLRRNPAPMVHTRPTLGVRDAAPLAWRLLTWPRTVTTAK